LIFQSYDILAFLPASIYNQAYNHYNL
jgi:hypothetical protein